MSARPSTHALDAVAQKWRALAERRRAHLVELYDTGRWKRYFTEAQFIHRMRQAVQQSERWAEIAPGPSDKVSAEQSRSVAAEPGRRTAA
jgi:uncharacterized repeat protein (TIGR03809 family)